MADRALPSRVATVSVHTSPLDQPGAGDAGGMNVFIVEVSKRLAEQGVEVDIFTRATSSDLAPVEVLAPGVNVQHITAGPFEGLGKNDLPAQLCAFTSAVLRAEASQDPGHYDVIHSHYWLSGQVGWLARDRWGVPLIHSAHTLAKVKNALLADGDAPEPRSRVIGEEQVVAEADRLIASTVDEAAQLVQWYDADPAKVLTIPPGVDLHRFRPAAGARARLGMSEDDLVLLFVGRIQPLKAPELLLRAAAHLIAFDPAIRFRLALYVVGAPSGSGLDEPTSLLGLAQALGLSDRVHFLAPMPPGDLADYYRAADVTVVPSHNESFGLVALESQACGTPVVAARVGGLVTAVADGISGLLVDGHRAPDYADAITKVLGDRPAFSRSAVEHAAKFSWDRTTGLLLDAYADAMAAPVFATAPAR